MSYTIKFLHRAEIEYFEAFVKYEEELFNLGDRFEFCVDKRIAIIANNPLLYPSKSPDYRECKIDVFPYLIIYQIIPQSQVILIVSIFHTSRRPNKKYLR